MSANRQLATEHIVVSAHSVASFAKRAHLKCQYHKNRAAQVNMAVLAPNAKWHG